MILEVTHKTSYAYSRPVSIAHHLLHLTPRPTDRQDVQRFDLTTDPPPTLIRDVVDYFGNVMGILTFEQEHRAFTATARSTVLLRPRTETLPEASLQIGVLADRSAADDRSLPLEIEQFVFESPYARCPVRLHDWAADMLARDRPVLTAALDLNGRINREFTYDPEATTVGTTVAESFEMRRGVCQDFTHLMLAALRSHGIPARYVSGYLCTRRSAAEDRLIGADASHAWVQVFAPPFGWIDLDPTNDVMPDQKHVTLAYGRDFADVSPVNGVIFGGGPHQVQVEVDVLPRDLMSATG